MSLYTAPGGLWRMHHTAIPHVPYTRSSPTRHPRGSVARKWVSSRPPGAMKRSGFAVDGRRSHDAYIPATPHPLPNAASAQPAVAQGRYGSQRVCTARGREGAVGGVKRGGSPFKGANAADLDTCDVKQAQQHTGPTPPPPPTVNRCYPPTLPPVHMQARARASRHCSF